MKDLGPIKDEKRVPNDLDQKEDRDLAFLFSSSPLKVSDSIDRKMYTTICQICRSGGDWSMGLQPNQIEKSIQVAYIELISCAEKFIYIENQFFVSSVSGNPVSNQIANAIIQRIFRAIEDKEEFLISVFLPLLPGFEGQVDGPSGNVLRIQLGWFYGTIGRGDKSIYEQ